MKEDTLETLAMDINYTHSKPISNITRQDLIWTPPSHPHPPKRGREDGPEIRGAKKGTPRTKTPEGSWLVALTPDGTKGGDNDATCLVL